MGCRFGALPYTDHERIVTIYDDPSSHRAWKGPFKHFNQVSRERCRTMWMQVRAGLPFNAQDGPKARPE